MSHILCPSCSQLAPASALQCAHCRTLLRDFRECPDCLERVRTGARVCRCCGYRFTRTLPPPVPASPGAPPPGAGAVPVPSSRPLSGAGAAGPSAAPAGEVLRPVAPSGDYTIGATALGGMMAERSLTALVAPTELRLSDGVLSVRRWSGLGFSSARDRLPVSRVSAVTVRRGVFCSSLRVEAAGSPPLEVGGLQPGEALLMKDLILAAAGLDQPPPAPAGISPSRLPEAIRGNQL